MAKEKVANVEQRGGSALLLRLFESSFFNVHLAVEYIKTYPNSIGITHYLVGRLRSFDAAEVEFYWPQLCHLVITLPTPSVALENFILERCEQDPHIAVITLWYLQSSLSDLFSKPTSETFIVCRRIYNRVQIIIFSDPPIPSASSSTLSSSYFGFTLPTRQKKKVNAPLASFVGMGLMAAGIALPALTETAGAIAIEQGRRIEDLEPQGDEENEEDTEERRRNSASGSGSEDDIITEKKVSPLGSRQTPTTGSISKGGTKTPPASLSNGKRFLSTSVRKSSKKSGYSRRQSQPPDYVPGARLIPSAPSTPLSSATHYTEEPSFFPAIPHSPSMSPTSPTPPNSSTMSAKPPLPSPTNRRTASHLKNNPTSLSVPSLPTSHSASYLLTNPTSSSSSLSGATLPGYGLPRAFLSQLLLLQSCRTQLDLLRSLQDISTRLVIVPKLARLSSLRAELTVLNHGLPRGCCLGMACFGTPFPNSSSSSPLDAKSKGPRAHARIVRISPSESVVLNSADRAPFVIHVEVLEGDLDFDPGRRQNAEDLRRALLERDGGSGGAFGGRGRKHPSDAGRMSLESGLEAIANGTGSGTWRTEEGESPLLPGGISSPGFRSVADLGSPAMGQNLTGSGAAGDGLEERESFERERRREAPPPETEMDLVEQLYGDISIRDSSNFAVDLEDKQPAIQNREVDEMAWSRKEKKTVKEATEGTAERTKKLSTGAGKRTGGSGETRPGGRSIAPRPAISLDDYAERMRMAAIMLAQLDASQAASLGVVATGTAAAGTLVGLPVATVAGIGGVVGGVVGAGIGAVTSRLSRRDVQAGQASTGLVANLDTASAASGTSSISGAPPLAAPPTSSAAPPPPPSQRPRVLAAVEATAIRNRIMTEMMSLEEERMERMREDGRARSGWAGTEVAEDQAVVRKAVNKDDPSGAVFAESFAAKTARIRAASPYGHLASWSVISVIVKTGADLRQEQLAVQLIRVFGQIWKEEKCPSWVRYFRILVTSESSGLIETITDAVSVHSIKKDAYARTAADGTQVFASYTLYDYYVETYGEPSTSTFRKAQDAFVKSLASYSVICYLLQLKDRHNGNILVDKEGHLIHIDFGFILSNSPGSLGFEMAPFKLPQDYIDILGGFEGDKFGEFKTLFKRAFRSARKHAERIITLVELMQKESSLPCFANAELTSLQLRERFQLSLTQTQVDEFSEKLIINAATSTFTRLYDLFQGYSNGIL